MSRNFMRAAVMAALMGVCAPVLHPSPALAATGTSSEIAALKAEMKQMQRRIAQLEQEQKTKEQEQVEQQAAAVPEQTGAQTRDNAFNPAISAVLNGHYASYTGHSPDIAGFAASDDAARPAAGLAIDEAEIGLSSNVDDKFTANVTASLSEQDGVTDISLEQAFIKTLGLPYGLGVTAGRFLAPIGYINDHHSHTDDFVDRSLPNRVFLNTEYKDDGVMASWILPTNQYAELGAGAFRGNDFPGGGSGGNNPGAWLAYARSGGDIGENQSWLASLSTLQASPGNRESNNNTVTFSGNSDLYAASLRYIWDPTGNSELKEVTLQGEYFWRHENGLYNDSAAKTGDVSYDGHQSGWYAQGVYKFAPQWRIGARYSMLNPGGTPAGLVGSALDAARHNPWNTAVMADWTNSEFSRIRLQLGHESPADGESNNQLMLQYVVSIGSHPAHTF